jgi:hypothetical protein
MCAQDKLEAPGNGIALVSHLRGHLGSWVLVEQLGELHGVVAQDMAVEFPDIAVPADDANISRGDVWVELAVSHVA